MYIRLLLAALCTIALTSIALSSSQLPTDPSATFDVKANQEIRMDLSAGEYRVESGTAGKVRVFWFGKHRSDEQSVRVRMRNENGRSVLETNHTKDVQVVIQVPAQSDLYIRLSAGELHVGRIEGHKDIALTAGELHVDVGDPAAYRNVESSVRIGEIDARAFHTEKDGFFRGFSFNGQGKYSLRATVGVGELVLGR
jgi:hypothetical protein